MATARSYHSYTKRGETRPKSEKSKRLSKALSWLLRHSVIKEGLQFQYDGYVFVEDVLRHPSFAGKYTLDDIHEVVDTNEKQRFGLKVDEVTGKEMIRAHQGHSIDDLQIDMREITDPNEFPTVVHGTYRRYWPLIRDRGLSKMQRTHIHFASGLPQQSNVISGMRSNVDVLIYIDLKRALEDGFKFFVSSNGVILCPGDANGYLPSRYFRLVEEKGGKQLQLSIDNSLSEMPTSNNQ